MIDFDLTEPQSLLQRTARAALREHSPLARVRALEASADGFDRALYRHMAELGWLSLLLPESLGGQGDAWVEAAILFEELGAALCPSPLFGAVLTLRLLSAFGGPAHHGVLAPIAAGDVTVAPAFWERSAKSRLHAVQTTGTLDGADIVINGEKRAVPFGHAVDHLLVAVRLESAETPVGLALIDRDAPGVTCSRKESLGGEPLSLVGLMNVRIPGSRLIALDPSAINRVETALLHVQVLRAAELIGVANAALDLAVSYAAARVQYGRPLGSFQAVQHKAANSALKIETVRGQVAYAAWLLAEGEDADGPVAEAVLQAGEMARYVTAEAVQTHGGLGIAEGSDVSMYFRRAKARQVQLGFPDALRERIATSLGL